MPDHLRQYVTHLVNAWSGNQAICHLIATADTDLGACGRLCSQSLERVPAQPCDAGNEQFSCTASVPCVLHSAAKDSVILESFQAHASGNAMDIALLRMCFG